jgi:hypothetical protein
MPHEIFVCMVPPDEIFAAHGAAFAHLMGNAVALGALTGT